MKPIPLAKAHLPANPGQGAAVSLVSITDVDGVNNFAPGQDADLRAESHHDHLRWTTARENPGTRGFLNEPAGPRHAGKIEPNIYAQLPSPARATATITYSIGGTEQPPEQWKDAEHPHATLSAVSVFDSDCASVHIKEKNEVAFRPFGLDVPDELANACQAVKEGLTNEQKRLEKARNPLFLKPSWKETTAVGMALAALKHDADVNRIEALAKLTDEESARLARLKEDLSKDPAKAAAEQTLKADNVKRLLDAVNMVEGEDD